jgi:predicted phage tail protein
MASYTVIQMSENTHYAYNNAPSKLTKAQLYQEYIKVVEHSKKNDFLLSCYEDALDREQSRTTKNHIKAQKDMIKAQKHMIEQYEKIQQTQKDLIKDYEDKLQQSAAQCEKYKSYHMEKCDEAEELREALHSNIAELRQLKGIEVCPASEDDSDIESDNEDTVEYFCKGCDRQTVSTETEYKCSEGLCDDCQKYL